MFSNTLIYIINRFYSKQQNKCIKKNIFPEALVDIIVEYSWEYTEHENFIRVFKTDLQLSQSISKDKNEQNNFSLITQKLNKYITFEFNEHEIDFLLNNIYKINFDNIYDNKNLIKNNEKDLKELLMNLL